MTAIMTIFETVIKGVIVLLKLIFQWCHLVIFLKMTLNGLENVYTWINLILVGW